MKSCFRAGIAALLVATAPLGALAADQMTFASPEEAAEAFISALRGDAPGTIPKLFGIEPDDELIGTDPERNRQDREDFVTAWNEMHRVTIQEDGSARIYIGRDQFPFPITLVKDGDVWKFDTEAGREELLERRIGRNELDVIDLLQGYVAVQSLFRETDWDGDGVMEFAHHIISDAEIRDGLYWPPADGVPDSPIGDAMARAAAQGYDIDGEESDPEPYLGYYFHILERQGENAPGGAVEYMINGNMVAGHAMIAFPSAYGDTGIMTFMVGENGVVLERDLGEETLDLANAIESFDPDENWVPAEQESN